MVSRAKPSAPQECSYRTLWILQDRAERALGAKQQWLRRDRGRALIIRGLLEVQAHRTTLPREVQKGCRVGRAVEDRSLACEAVE
jgi:hypothetical protein